jgi:hypothetical protein
MHAWNSAGFCPMKGSVMNRPEMIKPAVPAADGCLAWHGHSLFHVADFRYLFIAIATLVVAFALFVHGFPGRRDNRQQVGDGRRKGGFPDEYRIDRQTCRG